jgi:hypothetical protein
MPLIGIAFFVAVAILWRVSEKRIKRATHNTP